MTPLDPRERLNRVAQAGKECRDEMQRSDWKKAKASAEFMRSILGQVVAACDQQLEKEKLRGR